MPIYEYGCSKCGKTHEIIQKMSDQPLTECPSCSGKLHKLISQSSFHLKGSGWYATDYAKQSSSGTSPKKKDTTAAEKSSSADAPGKSE